MMMDHAADHNTSLPRPGLAVSGGRWHRLLSALRSGPANLGELVRATDPKTYPHKVERRKVRRALMDMADTRLVQKMPPWGWIATADGLNTLAQLDADRERAA